MRHRGCTIEETSNGYVVRLYETEDRSLLSADAEGLFIERTIVSVAERIESYFLLTSTE
jgi:hypothetical protein